MGLASVAPVTSGPLNGHFPPALVNTVAACRILGVHRATLYRWMARGLVKWVRMPNGHRRIVASSLVRDPEGA